MQQGPRFQLRLKRVAEGRLEWVAEGQLVRVAEGRLEWVAEVRVAVGRQMGQGQRQMWQGQRQMGQGQQQLWQVRQVWVVEGRQVGQAEAQTQWIRVVRSPY